MSRKFPRPLAWIFFSVIVLIAMLPALSFFPSSFAIHAKGASTKPLIPHLDHKPSLPLRQRSKGVDRTNLPTLPMLAGPTAHAQANKSYAQGALISKNITAATTTIYSSTFGTTGAAGWTNTVCDSNNTTFYPNGHCFWNIVKNSGANAQNLAVPAAINPGFVSYPDTSGLFPVAPSGAAFHYGDDTSATGSSFTYMGNQNDWTVPASQQPSGGVANRANSGNLTSPMIDLTTAPNATLTFSTWWEIGSYDPVGHNVMSVNVMKVGQTTSCTSGSLNPSSGTTVGGADNLPYSDNGLDEPASWHTVSVNLSPCIGAKVNINFNFNTVDKYDTAFRGWFIDNVGVYSTDATTPQISSVSPNTAVTGNNATIAGSGFGAAQSTSTVTFNGVAATVQSWSATGIVAKVPAGAAGGPLVVTVGGVQSIPVDFAINASISLSATQGPPRIAINPNGHGFAPGESISLYFNGVNGPRLGPVTADTTGSIPVTASAVIPDLPSGDYTVIARGSTSHITGGTPFKITQSLVLSTSSAQPGQVIAATALGYKAYESVNVQIDTTYLATLSCVSTGVCAGAVTIPSNPGVAGMHFLLGIGTTSAALTQAPITLSPLASLSTASGGPGTQTVLTGGAFAANEAVNVYWGIPASTQTLLGTAKADQSGRLYFPMSVPAPILPTNTTPLVYTITVTRTAQTPANVTTSFTVLPATMTSTAGILSGQSAQVQLTGFQANEQVQVTWNADGQQLSTFTIQSDGSGSSSFAPSSVPTGSYTLTAKGLTSARSATSPLNFGPGIQITPSSAAPGAAITVNGGGYLAGEKVNIYVQSTSVAGLPATGVVQVVTTTAGAFSKAITVPATYQANTAYAVYAKSATGSNSASVPFSFTPPSVRSISQTYGQTSAITGQGFVPGESITLSGAGLSPSVVTTAKADGTFSANVAFQSLAHAAGVSYSPFVLTTTGATSGLSATATEYEYPGIKLSAVSGTSGTAITVTLGGFGNAASVNLSFKGTPLIIAPTSATGLYTYPYTIPATTSIGVGTFNAVETNGPSASADFTVTPALAITPATGPSSSIITVTGAQYTAAATPGTVNLYWYNPATGALTFLKSVTLTATGTFQTPVTVPAGLTAGVTYYLQGYDAATGLFGQAAFVAQ